MWNSFSSLKFFPNDCKNQFYNRLIVESIRKSISKTISRFPEFVKLLGTFTNKFEVIKAFFETSLTLRKRGKSFKIFYESLMNHRRNKDLLWEKRNLNRGQPKYQKSREKRKLLFSYFY